MLRPTAAELAALAGLTRARLARLVGGLAALAVAVLLALLGAAFLFAAIYQALALAVGPALASFLTGLFALALAGVAGLWASSRLGRRPAPPPSATTAAPAGGYAAAAGGVGPALAAEIGSGVLLAAGWARRHPGRAALLALAVGFAFGGGRRKPARARRGPPAPE